MPSIQYHTNTTAKCTAYPTTHVDYGSSALTGVYQVSNSPLCVKTHTQHEHQSAYKIQHFFKKIIAARSYSSIFSNGEYFKRNAHQLPKTTGKTGLSALSHLSKVSNYYLQEIKQKLEGLSKKEQKLINNIMGCHLHFRHQSDYTLSRDNILSISSNYRLKRECLNVKDNTLSSDRKYLSNDDFVFFGIEFSEDKSQLPLNKKHGNMDYGSKCYMIEERKNYGYMTLTDHYCGWVQHFRNQEHQKFIEQFPIMKKELGRLVYGNKGRNDTPIFSQDDMKLGKVRISPQFWLRTRD